MGMYRKRAYTTPTKTEKSPETVAKWKASMGNVPQHTSKLTDEQRHFICRLISEFEPPKDIVRRVDEIYQIEIATSDVYYFSASKKWKHTIESYRNEYARYMAHIPIYHKRQRLEILQRQLNEIESERSDSKKLLKEKRFEERIILKQALEECQVWEQKAGNNTTNFVSIQMNAMDDSELLKRRDELLKRVSRYKEIPNGTDSVQADSPGGGREGVPSVRGQAKPIIDPEWEAEQNAREQRVLLGEGAQEVIDAAHK